LEPKLIPNGQEFLQLKDSYQTTYILENVIQNFTDFSDVVTDAQRLDRIKTEESKTNSSITK
jgi:hypothetical protein